MAVLPFSPSTICLGSCGFGSDLSEEGAFALMDRYAELGGNVLDTAHCYDFWQPGGAGTPERVIGRWLASRRAPTYLATKGGHPDAGPAYPRPAHFLAPERIAADVEESLDRLGIDAIDLYYLHRDDGETPVAEIIDALNSEISGGRVEALGASNWSIDRVREANAYAAAHGKQGFAALQNQWSLGVPTWQAGSDPTVRRVEENQFDAIRELGLTVFAYSSTSNGYFGTGGQNGDSFQSPANRRRLERAEKLASDLGITPTQVSLSWLFSQPVPVVPILGTKRIAHLEEAVGASQVHLDEVQRRWLGDVETDAVA